MRSDVAKLLRPTLSPQSSCTNTTKFEVAILNEEIAELIECLLKCDSVASTLVAG